MPKVSVIVPVYDVEKYIERCVRSLFEQTLDDIEYLFIDDCSTDRSIEILLQILDGYPDRKGQVKIHHMERNSGQAAVRKWGIQNATGDYVIHCDSDDWVETEMYELMYKKAVERDSDMVICDYCKTDSDSYRKIVRGCHSTNKSDLIKNVLFQRDRWSLWNKLVKKEMFNKSIVYPEGELGEDMVLTLQLINYCEKIDYIKGAFYNYFVNPLSITRKKTVENRLNNFYSLKKNTDFITWYIKEKYELDEKTKDMAIKYLRMINSFSLLEIRHLPQYKQLWDENKVRMPVSFFLNSKIRLRTKIIYGLSLTPFYPLKMASN